MASTIISDGSTSLSHVYKRLNRLWKRCEEKNIQGQSYSVSIHMALVDTWTGRIKCAKNAATQKSARSSAADVNWSFMSALSNLCSVHVACNSTRVIPHLAIQCRRCRMHHHTTTNRRWFSGDCHCFESTSFIEGSLQFLRTYHRGYRRFLTAWKLHEKQKLGTLGPGNYLPFPQGGGVHPGHPLKFGWHPHTTSATGGVKSSYTYPDSVYDILNYTRLLKKPKLL